MRESRDSWQGERQVIYSSLKDEMICKCVHQRCLNLWRLTNGSISYKIGPDEHRTAQEHELEQVITEDMLRYN